MKILLLGKKFYNLEPFYKLLKGKKITDLVTGETKTEVFACGTRFEILDWTGMKEIDKKILETCKGVIIFHTEDRTEDLKDLLSQVGKVETSLLRVNPTEKFFKAFDLDQIDSYHFNFDNPNDKSNPDLEEVFCNFTERVDGEEVQDTVSKIKQLQKEMNKSIEILEMKTKDLY